MENNRKGQVIIHSIDELRPSQKNQVKQSAIGIGLLMVLIYCSLVVFFDIFPDYKSSLFEGNIQLILLFAFGAAAFDLGYKLGFYMKTADLGFSFAKQTNVGTYSQSPNQPFSSSETARFQQSFQGNSVSINPSSGRPMSGSSGMDISGNPYGTRSW